MPSYIHIFEKYGLFFVEGDPVRLKKNGRRGKVAPALTDKHDMLHVIDDLTGSERNWHPAETEHVGEDELPKDASSGSDDGFYAWATHKPSDLAEGLVLTWRTKHVYLGVKVTMTGPIRRMCNGRTDTYHLLPPMTDWNGYGHVIPADLEWSHDVPKHITDIVRTHTNGHRLEVLLAVEGVELASCPFCGGPATWSSRDGFIGAMPHQHRQFSVGCCLRTEHYNQPKFASSFWNERKPAG